MINRYLYIPDEFKDKRVLLTSGTKGAGEAIVRRFALAGAHPEKNLVRPLCHLPIMLDPTTDGCYGQKLRKRPPVNGEAGAT